MAIHASFISLPKPLPLGEVDLRSKDGEGEDACLRTNPLSLATARQLPRRGSPWHGGKVSGKAVNFAGGNAPPGGAVAQRLRGYKWRSEKSVKAIAPTGAALAFLCFDFCFRIVKGVQPLTTGCGTQHPLRALGGTRVLLAAAPTTPPCFRRWRRSSSLHSGHNQRNWIFIRDSEKPAGFSESPFHGRGRKGKRHLQCRFLRKRGAAGGCSLPLGELSRSD